MWTLIYRRFFSLIKVTNMAAIAVAGVGLMVCCSSSVAAVMMGGGEEEPILPVGPSAPVYTPPTPVLRDTPETMRNASTVWSGEAIGVGHGRGRLDSEQGWSAQNNTVGEWYQLDNGVVGKIAGVAIKGRVHVPNVSWSPQYVKTFKVQSKGATG